MKQIVVTTGFGYFTDKEGHILSKAVLPAGKHNCKDSFNYVEVANEEALEFVEIYQDYDTAEIERLQNEQKIKARIRQTAIAELIKTGDLPEDYQ